MLKKSIEKISLEKFVYLGLSMFLVVFGLLLAVAPGIAAYSVLVVWPLIWIFFTVKKQIHRSKIHKLRSTIVQIIIILIAITFILIEYTPKDGFGLVYTLVFLILLFANFGVNVAFLLYDEHLDRKNSEVVDDLSEFKSVEQ